MKSRSSILFLILLFAAVLGYTVWNYVNGRTDLLVLLSAVLICGTSLIQAVRALIASFRKDK